MLPLILQDPIPKGAKWLGLRDLRNGYCIRGLSVLLLSALVQNRECRGKKSLHFLILRESASRWSVQSLLVDSSPGKEGVHRLPFHLYWDQDRCRINAYDPALQEVARLACHRRSPARKSQAPKAVLQ